MCGRFALRSSFQQIKKEFSFQHYQTVINSRVPPEVSYNIAPGQDILVLTGNPIQSRLEFNYFRWGLIPFWAKDQSIGNKLINARAETIDQKPSFKASFKQRRCLVVADGFYEWKKEKSGNKPYFIQMKDQKPFGFAAVYDRWNGPDQKTITSCAIITTESSDKIKAVHQRMPVILTGKQVLEWLAEGEKNKEQLKPYNQEDLEIYEVSNYVNSPGNNTEQCTRPVKNGDH